MHVQVETIADAKEILDQSTNKVSQLGRISMWNLWKILLSFGASAGSSSAAWLCKTRQTHYSYKDIDGFEIRVCMKASSILAEAETERRKVLGAQ